MTRLVVVLMMAVSLFAQAPMTMSEAVDSALRNYPRVRISQEADQCGRGRDSAGPNGLPAQSGRDRTSESCDQKQRVRHAAAAERDPFYLGSGAGDEQFRYGLGQCDGSAGYLGAVRFRLAEGERGCDDGGARRIGSRSQENAVRVSVAAADAYVTLVAAQETVRAAQAGVDRAEAISKTIHALVNAELRPGADASRVDAEAAAARTLLIQAQQAVDIARVNVSQFVGLPPAQIAVASDKLLQLPPEGAVTPLDTAANPVALQQNAVVEQLKAQLKVFERSYFPRFFAQASTYARGTGAEVNGNNLGGVNGLAPTIQNSALGFTVQFSALDRPSIRAKEAGQSAAIRAEMARYQQIATDLTAQWNRAVAMLGGARNVAANTPIEVSAARAATEQATARYQSGLGNIDAGRGSPATAHAVRDRRRAGPSRRVAWPARRCDSRGRYWTVCRRGEPVRRQRQCVWY